MRNRHLEMQTGNSNFVMMILPVVGIIAFISMKVVSWMDSLPWMLKLSACRTAILEIV